MKLTKLLLAASLSTVFFALGGVSAFGQEEHADLILALAHLREARAHLEGFDQGETGKKIGMVREHIDVAIAEIKKASVDDGKGLNDHPPVDVKLDQAGRLDNALDLLYRARTDIWNAEDDDMSVGPPMSARRPIDEAIRSLQGAIKQISARP